MYAIGKLSLESTALDHSAILPFIKQKLRPYRLLYIKTNNYPELTNLVRL
jgi:hypothetical protein